MYGVNQRLRDEDVDSPLCEIRPVKTVMLVVLSGDRGLCGGYNNFIIKKVRTWSPSTSLHACLSLTQDCPDCQLPQHPAGSAPPLAQ